MSYDPRPPAAVGLAGLTEWCRRDREPSRLGLAAAAGDPVAIAGSAAQLVWPHVGARPGPHVEIVAARRPDQLVQLASAWPDIAELPNEPRLLALWESALRHLAMAGAVNLPAVQQGPLAREAQMGVDEARPELGPVTWASFCRRTTGRHICLEELRAIASLGFEDSEFDIEPLREHPWSYLRVLRRRWQDAEGLAAMIDRSDLNHMDDPIDIAIYWEAAVATGCGDHLADRVAEHLTIMLRAADQPSGWWPAVLAVLTDWIVP